MSIQELQTSRLDINNNYEIDLTCKQLDDIVLKIIVYDKSLPADLSNYTARLKAFKSDQIPLIQNTEIYINENEVTLEGDPQLATTSGIVKAELQFIDKTTLKKKSSFYININVVASVLETDRGISVATCTLLKEIDNKLDQIENIGDILEDAIEINSELKDTTIPAANTANDNLESSIYDANASKLALDTSKTNADNSKSALDLSVTNADDSKSALDQSKTNADASKDALDASVEEANQFVQDHQDIENLVNQVNQNTADLSQNTQNIADTTKYSRHFKPKFGVPPFWGANSEYPTLPTREKILSDLTTIKEYGIDEISIIVHIDDSVSNNVPLHAVENIDDMEYAYEQAMLLGINVGMIKFHLWFDDADFINNASAYEIDYKNLITAWATRFQGKNIPYFTILNEVNYIYGNSTYEQFVVECLNIPKSYGFKTSVSTAGTTEMLKLSDNIKNNLDAFFINCYPMVSYKLENTTMDDSVHAWDLDLLNIKFLKQTYSNKSIIISETGCQDYYEALCNPGDSTWEDKGYTLTNGKAPYIFLKGLLLSDLQNYVERVHYWFNEALYYDEVKELIYEYTNGGNK